MAGGTAVRDAAPSAPMRADGVELLGVMAGSGYRKPPALVRRADGQTIQLTPLLYQVLEAVDGHRGDAEIAADVSERIGRRVEPGDVHLLVESKLRPLGVLRGADGSQPAVSKSNPLLALRFRWVVSDPTLTRRITAPFAALFNPGVVLLAVVAFVVTSGWVLFEKGLASAAYHAFDEPGLLLLVFAVTVLSAGFHEFGHAAACRYGGAMPGVMGAGLYLVWPAFYTEVSDSYRLSRGGRVRVDLGGLYFNAIVSVAMFAVWAATGWDALLLIIATQLLQMLRQLAPLVRFDGYHILADLVGVPDLYAHIKPTLMGLLPSRWGSGEGAALKSWAKAVVSIWVLLVVPLLLLSLVLMVLVLPRVFATGWVSLQKQWAMLQGALGDGDLASVAVKVLSIVAICLPLLAMVYLLSRIVRRTALRVWTATAGSRAKRTVAGVLAAALVAGVSWAWWPHGDTYQPIRPGDRGTLIDSFGLVGLSAPSTVAPSRVSGLQDGQVGAAQTVWAADTPLPTKESPQLALVLVPREGVAGDRAADPSGDPAAKPAWVFPFNEPEAPGEGDNQALAVNTEDGSTVYDVAFALVWVTDGEVDNTNEAYALASCTGCSTVAVSFQVVLSIGQADLVIPQNIAVAANYSCIECLTYALATQLVVTLPDTLSADAMAELSALWEQIEQFGADLEDIPLSQIRSELAGFESAILDILVQEGGSSSTGGGAGAGSPGGDPVTGSGSGTAPGSDPSSSTEPSSASSGAPSPQPATGGSTGVATPQPTTSPTTAEPTSSTTSPDP